jgi:DNA-binding transcriptional MerR regulator
MGGTYKTKDVAHKMGIPGNMVRKYSKILEQHGVEFEKTGNTRFFTMEDLRLLKMVHEHAGELNEDINEVVTSILQRIQHSEAATKLATETTLAPNVITPVPPPAARVATSSPVVEDVSVTIKEQNKKFEEFMNKLDTLAQLNEAIIHQNSTLISQNRLKDEKLDQLMQQVYVKESNQEEMIHDLVHHVHKSESKQEEKLTNLLSHLYKKEAKQNEKMGNLINHVYKKESSRDEQLMQLIREMQETKRMIAASQEQSLFKSIRNIFFRLKPEKAQSRS